MVPFLGARGWSSEPLADADRATIEAVILALGDRLKVFSDILKLGRYFFTTELTYDPDAVKKRLRKEGVPAMLARARRRARARSSLTTWRPWRRPSTTTPSGSGRKMGDVVNPLRVATTGQGVGPGLYDCLFILGRETCRPDPQTLAMLEQTN